MPIYRPQANNHIIWCIGANTFEYHCSMAVLVGLAE
jgi:methylamine dehydrogenase light chain